MPNVASIIITVDDAAATQAIRGINAEAAKLGPTLAPVKRISEQTFNNIEGGALRARESAALLGEQFGVHIPRALRGTLAQAALIGPALTAAFSGLAVIAFAQIAISSIDSVLQFIRDIDPEENLANRLMSMDEANRKVFHEAIKQEEQFAVQTKLATANESQKIEIQLAEDIRKINEQLDTAKATHGEKTAEKLAELIKRRTELAAAQQTELAKKTAIAVATAEGAANVARARGLAQIQAETEAQVHRIEMEKAAGLNAQVAEAQIAAARAEGARKAEDFNREIAEKQRNLAVQENKAVLEAEASTATGREQIEKELLVKLNEITQREVQETLALRKEDIKKQIALDNERAAARSETDHKLLEMQRANAEELLRVQEQTAVDMLPPWQRSYAQISADTQRRLREIQLALKETRITAEDAAKLTAAAWQEQFAKMRDQLAGDLERLFDDITSGNIGKAFLAMFKHLVFQMIATWILGMNQMRAASQGAMGGGGGGILRAIFGALGLGKIFGGGGGGSLGGIFGGGSASGGPGGTPPFIGSLFGGGGGSSNAGLIASAGGLSALPTALSGDQFAAIAPLAGLGLSAGLGAGGFGTVLPSGAGAAAGTGGIGGLLRGLLKNPALLTMGGLALLGSSFGKGGILAGLMGAAGGGLATFGALSPFLAAGPLGFAIVGIGALLGFLGGFFQHSTRKARLAIQHQIEAQSKAIEDSYNIFQIDYASARDQLEQMRLHGVDALRQAGVKDISRSRVGHVDFPINKIEKEIDATEAERQRRAAIAFGPAEFRMGGYVGAGLIGTAPAGFAAGAMQFALGGAVPAILHAGEFVMRPEAVSRIGRGTLEGMNSGRGGGGEVHLHITAMDAKSFESWLKSGAGTAVLHYLRFASNTGML